MSLNFETYTPVTDEVELKITPVETEVNSGSEVVGKEADLEQKMSRKEILAKVKAVLGRVNDEKEILVDNQIEADDQVMERESVETESRDNLSVELQDRVDDERVREVEMEQKEKEVERVREVEPTESQAEVDEQMLTGQNNETETQLETDLVEPEIEEKIFNEPVKEEEQVFQPEIYDVSVETESPTSSMKIEMAEEEKEQLVDPDLIPTIPVPDFSVENETKPEVKIAETKKEIIEQEEIDNSTEVLENEEDKLELTMDETVDNDAMIEEAKGEDLVDEIITELKEEAENNEIISAQVNEKENEAEEKEEVLVDLPPPTEFQVELKPLKELESQVRDLEEVEEVEEVVIQAENEASENNENEISENKEDILEESEELVKDEKEEKKLAKEGKDGVIEQASQQQLILQKLNKLKEIDRDLLKRMK